MRHLALTSPSARRAIDPWTSASDEDGYPRIRRCKKKKKTQQKRNNIHFHQHGGDADGDSASVFLPLLALGGTGSSRLIIGAAVVGGAAGGRGDGRSVYVRARRCRRDGGVATKAAAAEAPLLTPGN